MVRTDLLLGQSRAPEKNFRQSLKLKMFFSMIHSFQNFVFGVARSARAIFRHFPGPHWVDFGPFTHSMQIFLEPLLNLCTWLCIIQFAAHLTFIFFQTCRTQSTTATAHLVTLPKNLGTYETVSGYIHRVSPMKQGKKASYSAYLQTTPDVNQGMLPLLAFSHAKKNLLKEFADNKTSVKLTNVSSEIDSTGQKKLLLNNNTLISGSDDCSFPYSIMCAYPTPNLKDTSVRDHWGHSIHSHCSYSKNIKYCRFKFPGFTKTGNCSGSRGRFMSIIIVW